jgi:hypothetical protein
MTDQLCVTYNKNFQDLFSGMDHIDYCRDQAHFERYPWPVNYRFNSRGFRDQDWPNSREELESAIWCVGDSFTVGIGQPFEHTWPQVLAKHTVKRCINLGKDGASNDTIARTVLAVIDYVQPANIVVMWSYIHRRSIQGTDQHFNPDSTDEDDVKEFDRCVRLVDQHRGSTHVVHAVIPWFAPGEWIGPALYSIQDLPHVPYTVCLDWARDGHHFDRITSEWMVTRAAPKLRL